MVSAKERRVHAAAGVVMPNRTSLAGPRWQQQSVKQQADALCMAQHTCQTTWLAPESLQRLPSLAWKAEYGRPRQVSR